MRTVILVDHTGHCEKNVELFLYLNKKMKVPHEISVAYTNLSNNVTSPDFAIINMSEIYSIKDACMIATSIETAEILNKANVKADKIFYMWDLSFLSSIYDFLEKWKTFSEMALITRSEEHARVIKNIFNLDSLILPDFELDAIWNSLENTKIK
jgi:hypothetical protein